MGNLDWGISLNPDAAVRYWLHLQRKEILTPRTDSGILEEWWDGPTEKEVTEMAVTSTVMNDQILGLTPGASEWDVSNLIARRQEKGTKFEEQDIYPMEAVCRDLASRYAQAYEGHFSYMLDMKKEVYRGRLSIGKIKGIINAWYNDVRSIQIQSERDARTAQQLANTLPDVPDDTVPEDPAVADGYYTFSFQDGTHLTVRILVKAGDPKTQKISALVGPNNESDYQPYGFLKGTRYVPFSAYRKGYDRWHFVARAMVNDMTEEQQKEAGLRYAQQSGRCMKCGRTLTDPVSISLGIGPTCRGE